jgi:hypothetical protein
MQSDEQVQVLNYTDHIEGQPNATQSLSTQNHHSMRIVVCPNRR